MALLLSFLFIGSCASAQEARTSFGTLSGTALASVDEFLGIPFAQPPVGPLRFAAPRGWTQRFARRSARAFGPRCPQPGQGKQDEDCLFLNIWAPRLPGPLPVMVFIPGGSFLVGAGDQYNGTQLALTARAVVVTLNHRVGAFGFLLLGSAGNFGLLDQQCALRWLHREIHTFGGDASQLVLFGQSSGGESTGFQFLLPGSRGLASAAIMQSGVPVTVRGDYARGCGRQLAALLNCSGLKCLRELPWQRVLEAQNRLLAPPPNGTEWDVECAFWPAVDGATLPAAPDALVRAGALSDVPVIVGTNHDEGDVFAFLDFQEPMQLAAFRRTVNTVLNARGGKAQPGDVERLVSVYGASSGRDLRSVLGQLLGDFLFSCRARRLLRLRARGGAFKYVFSQRAAHDPSPETWGVYHSSELPFLWGASESGSIAQVPSLTAHEENLGHRMRTLWGAFAAKGSLGGWPAHNSTEDVHLDLSVRGGIGRAFRHTQCGVWDMIWDRDELPGNLVVL